MSLVLYDLGEESPSRIISYEVGVWQSLHVFGDGEIYGVVYIALTDRFRIVCVTLSTGERTELGISYDEEILVVVDRMHIYVLLKDSNRIAVYSKRTLMKLWELQIISDVNELILPFGKFLIEQKLDNKYEKMKRSEIAFYFVNIRLPQYTTFFA